MEECFAAITPHWLNRAYLYNGAIGPLFHDFRYRLEQNEKEKKINAATYSKVCYEKADDVEEREFAWDEEGVAALRDWLQAQYEKYLAREAEQHG